MNGERRALHSFVRIAVLFVTMVVVFIRPGFQGELPGLMIWLLVVGSLLVIWGLERRRLVSTLETVLMLSVLLIISQGFLYQDSGGNKIRIDLVDGYSIALSRAGLVVGVVGSLKILLVLMAGQLVVSGLEIEEFAFSLTRLGLPLRAAHVVTISLRFIPLISQKWVDMLEARRLRGIDVEALGIVKRLTSFYPSLVVPLVLSSLRTGLDMEVTLFSRGFYTNTSKTVLCDYPMRRRDYLALFFVLLGGVFSVYFSLERSRWR